MSVRVIVEPTRVSGVRAVLAVAFQRAMSNGPISRRIGWLALVLLPLTIPVQLPAVLLGGDRVLHTPGASLMRGRVPQVRRTALLASLLGPVLLIVVIVLIDFVTRLPAGWVFIAAVTLIVVELAGSLPAQGVRPAWRAVRRRELPVREPGIDTTAFGTPVTISFVVAFPRGGGRGSTLMSGLVVLLDAAAQPAVLTARTAGLVEFYGRYGFRSLDGDPRQMLRLPVVRPASRRNDHVTR